jgi:predicted aspartyl protease
MRFLGLLVCVGLSAAPLAVAAPDCALKKLASFDVTIDSGALLTKAQIDGKDVQVMLDTGSPYNLINKYLADELKLPRQRMQGYTVTDAAGKEISHTVRAHTIALGDFKTEDVPFLVAGEDEHGHFSRQAVIGNMFLEGDDLELDLAHGKVSIFLPDHCPGQVVYWTHEYVPIPIKTQESGHIVLPVTLDGKTTFALLDTGASRSLVSKRLAETNFNIVPEQGKDKPDGFMVAGTGATLPIYRHIFGKFDIGGIEFHNTELEISPDRMDRAMSGRRNDPHITLQEELAVDTPIVLGLPHLAKLRLYFAFKEHMLYVTPANAH